MKAKPAASFEVPTLESASPEYQQMLTTQARLRDELGKVEEELQIPIAEDVDDRATALIDGKGEEPRPLRDALERRRNDLKRALEILDKRVSEERLAVSDRLCREIEPHYRALVGDLCQKIATASEANQAVIALMMALNDNGIAWAQLVPMPCQFMKRPVVAHYLRRAMDNGFIAAKDIPRELLDETLPYSTREAA